MLKFPPVFVSELKKLQTRFIQGSIKTNIISWEICNKPKENRSLAILIDFFCNINFTTVFLFIVVIIFV